MAYRINGGRKLSGKHLVHQFIVYVDAPEEISRQDIHTMLTDVVDLGTGIIDENSDTASKLYNVMKWSQIEVNK